MDVISAADVYKSIKELTEQDYKENGFTRTKERILGWYKPLQDEYFIVTFWCWPKGSDKLAGSKFTVELELSSKPKVMSGHLMAKRIRLVKLMSEEQKKQIIENQNRVIGKLEKPGKDHFIYKLPQKVIDSYLWEFTQLNQENALWYKEWFRYKDREDIEMWINFLQPIIKDNISVFIEKYSNK
jgi:hypothetical protein